MKCKEAKILLSAAIDGELTPGEELALDQHVTSCAGCAMEKAEFVRLSETMPLWADEEPSTWLAEKFSYKLAEVQQAESVRPPRRVFRWGTLSAVTGGLAAAVLAIGLLIHSSVPPAREVATTPRMEQKATTAAPPVVHESQPVVEDNVAKVAAPAPVPAPAVRLTSRTRSSGTRFVASANVNRSRTPVHVAPTPAPAPSRPEAAVGGIVYADSTSSAAAMLASSTISENLGEASLAMNDTVERVRGNLQKSVDLIVSQPPVPVTDSTRTDGGI